MEKKNSLRKTREHTGNFGGVEVRALLNGSWKNCVGFM
jgi:hypothetical protein